MMSVSIFIMVGDIILSKFVDKLSWPELDFGFSLFTILVITSESTVLKLKVVAIFSVR